MLFDEADSELLKTWVIKRLEAVSDADPDVLGDYVIALVSTDDAEPAAKANCNENLKDFLGDSSDAFVDDLFRALATQSYNPAKAKPPTAPTYQPPRRTSLEPPRQTNESKKRSYHDWDRDESHNGHFESHDAGERPMKQPRRGRGAFDQRGGRQQQHQHGLFAQPPFPHMPAPPPGMPPFDMSNPMAFFSAMQQVMGMMPGFPPQDQNAFPQKPCNDFNNKGYCTRGAACQYDHGTDAYVVPPNDEYDPNQATLLHVEPNRTGVVRASPSSKGRGRGRGRGGSSNFRGGGKRSDVSMQGQNHDRSIVTIVVEQIPEDKFDEQQVREFFGEFGNIEEVQMQPYKRLALVKYDNYDSAKAAYDCPKVVFDNRFVKVYWHKPETPAQPQTGIAEVEDTEVPQGEPQLDHEEIARKQEEAQRKHDEQKRQREEADNKKKQLDAKVKAIEAERKKMAEALAKKSGKLTSASTTTSGIDSPADTDKNKGLRDQLAKLEAEAKSLGLDPNAAAHSYDYGTCQYPRGRGGFRGRYRGRGGYNPSFRGGWQGGGAVKRLDNRPKTVAVTFLEGSYEDHDEALRQWLLFSGGSESATLSKHPSTDRHDTALVAFPERYLGENFFTAAATRPDFPLSGKVELSWYKQEQTDTAVAAQALQNDTEMHENASAGREMDQDDRDDDDRW